MTCAFKAGVGDIRPTPVARPCDIYAEPGLERAAPHGLPGVLPAIFVPPLLLYVRGERRGYAQTVLALTVAYVACWVIFAVAPVEGPRYLWTPNAPDGPARRLAVAILAAGSSRGAAFPSSHMAVSVVQTVLAFRWQPKVGAILALVSVLVGLGAVYGGFHYGVDMIAGAVLGFLVGFAVLKAGPPARFRNHQDDIYEISSFGWRESATSSRRRRSPGDCARMRLMPTSHGCAARRPHRWSNCSPTSMKSSRSTSAGC